MDDPQVGKIARMLLLSSKLSQYRCCTIAQAKTYNDGKNNNRAKMKTILVLLSAISCVAGASGMRTGLLRVSNAADLKKEKSSARRALFEEDLQA